MTRLTDEISQTLLPGMSLPRALELLFSWIESNGLFIDSDNGQRIGFLFPPDELESKCTDTQRPGGTIIKFFAQGNVNLKYWFGHESPEVLNRLCVFAQTGAEGSMAAFWLDCEGKQKIVHLGSGSGSTLVCVLADTPVDFLRLLAIGYDEICWSQEFSRSPNANLADGECFVYPNIAYQQWVRDTFSVDIPKTAHEIVKCPSERGDLRSDDPFCRWVEQNVQ